MCEINYDSWLEQNWGPIMVRLPETSPDARGIARMSRETRGGRFTARCAFAANFYTFLKKRITPADSLQAATAADCRDLRRYLFCPLFFVMAADFSSFHFICTVSCTIQSKMFVANTISDSLALLLRRSEAAPESDELL